MRTAFHIAFAFSLLGLTTASASGSSDLWQGERAAFFGIVFIDASLEGEMRGGPSEEEVARTAMLEEHLASVLQEQGLLLADLTPVEAELTRTRNPARCNGCDLRMARELDARYSIVAEVQKISNLIMKMNVQVRDAQTSELVRGSVADFRANTDESWTRAMDVLLSNTVLADSEGHSDD
ncbi:MAG TPA: DUF3280 domain-containing protein [Kiloniellales bacterium]|nr:DUF3280 domain-containing protein [Kiloniellales bacterium]